MVEIAFPRGAEFQMEQALDTGNRTELERVFEEYFRSTRRLKGILGSHVGESEREKKATLRDDPRIGRILDTLDGEIV